MTLAANLSSPLPAESKRHHSGLLSGFCCALVVFAFAVVEELRGGDQLWHWFVLPVFLCGWLVAEDALRWLSGEVDVLDPVGVLGLFGVHFFFLAPLLHVSWGYWMEEAPSASGLATLAGSDGDAEPAGDTDLPLGSLAFRCSG